MGAVGVSAFGQLKTGGFDAEGAQSTRANEMVDTTFGGAPNLVLLVRARNGSIDSPAAAASGAKLADDLAQESGVHNVTSYWLTHSTALKSKDGTAAEIVANVDADNNELIDHIVKTYAHDTKIVTVEAGGGAVVNRTVNSHVREDLARAEAIAIPLTLLLLVLAFGGFVAATLPLAVGLVAILGTFAELSLLGRITDVAVYAINLTTALALALGVDYALLMVARYRELAGQGLDGRTAVVITVRTAGRTILFSAATVIAALAALLMFPLYFLRSFAYAGIGVVTIAAAAALILMPALLTVLGPRVEAGRLPWSRTHRGSEAPFWGRLAGAVMRRPLVALAPLALLLAMASPLAHAVFGTPDEGVLPASAPARHTSEELRTAFNGDQATTLQVVVQGDPATLPDTIAHLPHVAHVAGRTAADTNTHLLTVSTDLTSHSTAAQQLVGDIRALPAPHNATVLVTGDSARLVDTNHAIDTRLPYAAGLVGLTTLIVLFLFTGSIAQPIRALILNALGMTASLGTMVDLPGRPPLLVARLHPAPDGHSDDRGPVLHRLRPVDGLRGVPHQSHQGTSRRRSQHLRSRHPGTGAHRTDRVDRGRPPRGQLLRLRHRLGQLPADVRPRLRTGHPSRRPLDPRHPRAGRHAAPRPPRLDCPAPPAPPPRPRRTHRDRRTQGPHSSRIAVTVPVPFFTSPV